MTIIKCPHCEYEYLPAEIFIPKYLVGSPEDIERDTNGKILNYYGPSPILDENYTCDKCNKKFIVEAELKFNTKKNTILDFSEEFTSQIYTKDRFVLEEK